MITVADAGVVGGENEADARPADMDALMALYAELDEFYGVPGARDAPAERASRAGSASPDISSSGPRRR